MSRGRWRASTMSATPLVHTEVMNASDVDRAGTSQDVERCPECHGRVVPIAYGFPGPEMFEAAERGEIVLGGCMLDRDDPTHSCECGATTSGSLDSWANPTQPVDPRRPTEVSTPSGEAAGRGGDLVAFSIDEARSYIGQVRWQFAKTMPQWPHEYTVREWRPDLEETFEAFARYTRSEGVVKPWPADSPTPRYHHRYLAIDGWDYWIMDGTIEETGVINRARLDEPGPEREMK